MEEDPNQLRRCPECGHLFEPATPRQTYCTVECYDYEYGARYGLITQLAGRGKASISGRYDWRTDPDYRSDDDEVLDD